LGLGGLPTGPSGHLPAGRGGDLSSSAAPGAEAFYLASFRRWDVVRTASHLAHEPLLLHLAAELPESLLELLGILDYDSHNRTRIPVRATSQGLRVRVGSPPAEWEVGSSTGR
jgi:hypothetical protein